MTTKKNLAIADAQNIETAILRHIDAICDKSDLTYYLVCGSVLGAVRHSGPIPWDSDVDITVPFPELDRFCEVMEEGLRKTAFCIYIPGRMTHHGNITTFPRIALRGIDPRVLHVDVFPQIGISSRFAEQEELTRRLTDVKTRYRNKRISEMPSGNSLWAKAASVIRKVQNFGSNADKLLQEFQVLCNTYGYDSSQFVTNPCGHYGMKNVLPKEVFGIPVRLPYEDMFLPVPAKVDEYLKHYYGDYMQYPPQEVIDKGMSYSICIEGDFDGQAL